MDSIELIPPELDVEEERALIDTKIQELELELASLKKRRNSLSYIFRIPSDVLVEVFKYVTGHHGKLQLRGDIDVTDDDTRMENKSEIRWIRAITYVCSSWRDLAVASPSLWSRIRLNFNNKMVQEMLKRSRTLPLTISLIFIEHNDHDQELESILLNPVYSQRIKHFELGVRFYWSEPVIDVLKSHPLMNLESLSLSTFHGSLTSPFAAMKLPIEFLTNSSDTLRQLQIIKCTFDFRTIKDTISFPKLTQLVLKGRLWDVVPLLGHLSFPQTCKVTIETWDGMSDAHDLKEIIQKTWGAPSAGTNQVLSRLTLTWSIFRFATDKEKDSDRSFTINHYHRVNQGDLDLFALEDVRTFRAMDRSSGYSIDHNIWRIISQGCPNVTTASLVISDSDTIECLKEDFYFLGPNSTGSVMPVSSPGQNTEASLTPRAFPKLKRLELPTLCLDQFSESKYSALLNFLKERYELGTPIKHLTLKRITESYLQEISPYVDGEIISNPLIDKDEEEEEEEESSAAITLMKLTICRSRVNIGMERGLGYSRLLTTSTSKFAGWENCLWVK